MQKAMNWYSSKTSMDSSSETASTFNAPPEFTSLTGLNNGTTSDQHFLLFFIMGTYFGPDLKSERPRKSALQRIAEGLPSYTSSQLEGSSLKATELVSVYYYVLRNADPSARVKVQLVYKFFRGHLPPPEDDPAGVHHQFPAIFPLHLHRQTRPGGYKVIENIVFISNPDISYVRPEEMNRFRRLTGIEDLMLDRDAARAYSTILRMDGLEETQEHPESNGRLPLRRSLRNSRKRRRAGDHVKNGIPQSQNLSRENHMLPLPVREKRDSVEKVGPAMLFLPSHPTIEEWDKIVSASKGGIALTGSVASVRAGPLIGLVDIGASEDAYLFRISLPGVKKDEREFSCEVESDGRVLIRGVTTTGEKRVLRHSHVFEMRTQRLCASGPFTVSFQLPGPVEPRQFSGNFGADGILEGIVMKDRR
ncbi:Increased DNA methylation 2 [Nymphaea thermarum]|nr:Increased DNA methylation 2 [Nymphaea thermarum]